MKKLFALAIVGLALLVCNAYAAETYKIDPVHSTIGFSVTHLKVSQVTGQFDNYDGTIEYDPNALGNTRANVTIQAVSIDTHVDKRDEHLRSSDFFDVAHFPTINFVIKQVTPNIIVGNLTMRGVTNEVSIPVTILGPVKTPSGSSVMGITGSFKLNRQDYGIKWNKALDFGGVMVSDDVTVNINIEAVKIEAVK